MDDLNGSVNGSAKGSNGSVYMNGKANGHALKPSRRTAPPPRRNFVASTFSMVAR
jgi:hypothetical protein